MDFLNDPKNRPYVIGGTIVVLAVAALLVWMMLRSRGTASTGLSPAGPVVPAQPGAVGTGGPGGPVGTGASPAGEGGPLPPEGSTVGAVPSPAAAPAPAGEATQVALANPLPSRADPFQRVEGHKSVTRLSLPRVMVRKREAEFLPAEATEERQVATTEKRMAGIVWDGGIAAILVDEDKSYVVRPGDVIGNMKVVAIRRNSLTLRIGSERLEEVFLRPAAPRYRQAGTGAPTGGPGTVPGGPTFGPGGPGGRPGGRPGGGAGFGGAG
jgi:hypothetical protein